ncbi:hypothetical protein OS493_015059 [Desmophyllum pertusum]|uniref:Uncharacterized protein n=1 Tax=Desmophyllum pertusum TaxID=174260 RepID=A0A9W9ZQS2_9CNID|nr:hypothetical protein OS493_015059 [Desmophyllum pertusum]
MLDYSQGKQSPARFGKVQDFKVILAEIGKVALECLLKDDHVFEYDQLSAAILCEESLIIGLLQVTEYAENLRPAGMVSFIHKSIQEFLAAWYITYSCVPEGNLGGIEDHALTLEDCETLENVFQFICGLSDGGAVKILDHLTSVRISHPTLDLSKTIPDVENETAVPLCDVTDKHCRFSDLVYISFQEVHSKVELLSHCFNCTGGIVLVTEQLTELLQKAKGKDLTQVTHSGNFLYITDVIRPYNILTLYEFVEFLDCLHVPLRITESSEVVTVGDLLRKFQNIRCLCRCDCPCNFISILCFRNGQFHFYITELNLCCDDHARLFTETTDISSSLPANLSSEQSCLKFLTSLQCYCPSDQVVKALGGVIRNCKHLKWIKIQKSGDYVCDLLEQVVNPSKCVLEIGFVDFHFRREEGYPTPTRALKVATLNLVTLLGKCDLTSAGAVKLARLLPRCNNIITLRLNLNDCCAAAVDTLVPSITHKTLKKLVLWGISLTPTAAATLGRSLPGMSSLQTLKLTGANGSILQGEELQALFGGFNEILPLHELEFCGFSTRGCHAPLAKSLRFFPNLRELYLGELNLDNLCDFLESLRFIHDLKKLSVQCKPLSHGHCCTEVVTENTDSDCFTLKLRGISLTPAVAAALGRSLPEMSSLQTLEFTEAFGSILQAEEMSSLETLKLTGEDGSILQAEEMEALFGGFNRTLPLCDLTFSDFSVISCLAPLTKSFRFFPNLSRLYLGKLNMDERNLCHLLESLRFIPNLEELSVHGKPLSHAHCCTAEVNTAVGFTHKTLRSLVMSGISLTPAAAAALGRSLPEMSSLEMLRLTLADGSNVQGEEMEALFGGFNETLPLSNLSFSGFSTKGCVRSARQKLSLLAQFESVVSWRV